MAAFGTGANRSLQGRGGSPGFRALLYAALAVVIMVLDQRNAWFERAHYLLQAAAYPIQLAVNSPSAAWHWLEESFETRETLQAENQRLKTELRTLELRSMRFEALARENGQLRGLKDALPAVAERWLPAEFVNVQLNSLRQRVLINRGTVNGVFKGQAVLDEQGLVGQTIHVGPWSAEVILLTDPEHAVPVQIERTGLRTIAVGAGDTTSLALPYLPANADIQKGDLLVTSGLGGVFPAGYPVARVTEVHRDAVQPLAQVRAAPLARIDTDREVVLVWFREDHPAAPVAPTGDLHAGNATLQPQPAPPKPPAPTAGATAAPTGNKTPATGGNGTAGSSPKPGAVPTGNAKASAGANSNGKATGPAGAAGQVAPVSGSAGAAAGKAGAARSSASASTNPSASTTDQPSSSSVSASAAAASSPPAEQPPQEEHQ